MSVKSLSVCPCGSNLNSEQCCLCYISGAALPQTAEQLMRSRYTAYTQANITYIQATMRGLAAEDFNTEAAYQWAKTVKWKRLTVLETYSDPQDENHAFVKFKAYYIYQGKPHTLSEISEFKRIAGQWFYVNGEV